MNHAMQADIGYKSDLLHCTDQMLVAMAREKNEAAIRTLVRRHNQRLFRVARAVVRSDAEAEDVVQAAYVKAFTHLSSFRGEAEWTTWLTRVVVNEALGRLRKQRPLTGLEQIDVERGQSAQIIQFPSMQEQLDPEVEMSRLEMRRFLEQAVDELPSDFRAVFILRDVQGMSVEETAATLDLKSETVRTRLFRARQLLRRAIEQATRGTFESLFPFDGQRCVFMADRVLADLRALHAVAEPGS